MNGIGPSEAQVNEHLTSLCLPQHARTSEKVRGRQQREIEIQVYRLTLFFLANPSSQSLNC